MTPTIKRSGKTNQFIVELRDGADTMRCAVHIEGATGDAGGRAIAELEAEAFERALRLARALRGFESPSGIPVGFVGP